jgi:predicted amino acid dehydrogenase
MAGDLLRIESYPSLRHAVVRGLVEPVAAAAIAYIPPLPGGRDAMLRRELFARGRPAAVAVHQTPVGSIGLVAIPTPYEALYADRRELLRQLLLALEEAGHIGARVVSLTGLIPSATGLGEALEAVRPAELPAITTGHATTVSAVVLALQAALDLAGADLRDEEVAYLGLGSIGAAALRLAMNVLPPPRAVLLCDLYSSRERLSALAAEIEGLTRVEVVFAGEQGVPDRVYDARVIVGATNVPSVLDVDRLAPGTIVVDDSAPHCFDTERMLARVERTGDVLAHEGGLVRSRTPIAHSLFLPDGIRARARDIVEGLLSQQALAHDQIMGCVLSSALSASSPDLPRTIGAVDAAAAEAHFRALQSGGFGAPRFQCDRRVWTDQQLERFRGFARPDGQA